MKNNTTPTSANHFKIKFSPVILLLSVLVYILCALGIAVSIWRIIKFGIHDFSDIVKYPFLIAVCVFCIVLITAVLIKSYYSVESGMLVTHFGFIKTSYAIKDMRELTLDCDAKKLTVTFEDGQYMTLTVNAEWNEALVRAMLDTNPDIDYSFTLSDVPDQEKKDGKK